MTLQKKLSLTDVKKYILDIFFPNRCPFCSKIIKWNELSCEKCIAEIPFIDSEHCKRCGKDNCICSEVKLYYDGCASVTYYSGVIKKGIVNIKINKAFNLADFFQDEICKRLSEIINVDDIDFVTSVPMNKKAKRERGYNQADIIAKKVSESIQKPVISDVLIKNRNDIIQHKLNREERAKLIKGLYKVNANRIGNINGKVILLCDDVVTTGSTLNECAHVLKQNGAKAVYCITIATTKLRIGQN